VNEDLPLPGRDDGFPLTATGCLLDELVFPYQAHPHFTKCIVSRPDMDIDLVHDLKIWVCDPQPYISRQACGVG
jgi:hypothetical protein